MVTGVYSLHVIWKLYRENQVLIINCFFFSLLTDCLFRQQLNSARPRTSLSRRTVGLIWEGWDCSWRLTGGVDQSWVQLIVAGPPWPPVTAQETLATHHRPPPPTPPQEGLTLSSCSRSWRGRVSVRVGEERITWCNLLPSSHLPHIHWYAYCNISKLKSDRILPDFEPVQNYLLTSFQFNNWTLRQQHETGRHSKGYKNDTGFATYRMVTQSLSLSLYSN